MTQMTIGHIREVCKFHVSFLLNVAVLIFGCFLSGCDVDGTKEICYRLGYAQGRDDAMAKQTGEPSQRFEELSANGICR